MVSFVLPLLAIFSFTSAVAAQTGTAEAICSASQFASLGCLSHHAGAASLCKKLPQQTFTLTTTTTTLQVNSVTVTTRASSQTTVHITSTQMSTVYVTRGAVRTTTTYETVSETKNATLTTYIPATKMAALIEPTCNPGHAISSLGGIPKGVLATVCSCIGHPAETTTTTKIVTAPAVNTRTTAFAGRAPTTTIYNIALSTTTVIRHPAKFITKTTTECTTSTTTVAYAAPSFTQVFFPQAGCADSNAASSKILPHDTKNLHSAAQQCKARCAQDAECAAVYVQHMAFKKGGPQHYHCFINPAKLNADADLECSKPTAIFGTAIGYDAYGRGTEAL